MKYFIIESSIGVNLYDVMERHPGCNDSAASEVSTGLTWKQAFRKATKLNRSIGFGNTSCWSEDVEGLLVSENYEKSFREGTETQIGKIVGWWNVFHFPAMLNGEKCTLERKIWHEAPGVFSGYQSLQEKII